MTIPSTPWLHALAAGVSTVRDETESPTPVADPAGSRFAPSRSGHPFTRERELDDYGQDACCDE